MKRTRNTSVSIHINKATDGPYGFKHTAGKRQEAEIALYTSL